MFHLAAFYKSLAQNAAYSQLNAVADAALSQNPSGQYIAPSNLKVLAAHVQGVTVSRCQIQAPSLRNIAFPEVYPIVQAARTTVPDLQAVQIYGDNGPRLMVNESFALYASENNTGASPTNGALWVSDRPEAAPPGMQITLVATVTLTLVDTAWVLGSLTFETSLAAGEYVVTGMDVLCVSANYARLVFPGQTNWRPGVPCVPVLTKKQWRDSFRLGRLGAFGRFQFNAPPQLEVFGSAAGAQTATVYMDVIKVA